MKALLHHQRQEFEIFLADLEQIHQSYKKQNSEFTNHLLALLIKVNTHFKDTGKTALSSKVQSLESEYHTILRGINPMTFEKIHTNKRKTQWAVLFKVFQMLKGLILEEFEKAEQILEDEKETIGQIVLTALQAGLIKQNWIQAEHKEKTVKQIIKIINNEPQLRLLNQKISLRLHYMDIELLYANILTKLAFFKKEITYDADTAAIYN